MQNLFSSRASQPRFSSLAILLHWTMAVLIIGMLAVGWIMTSLHRGDPLQHSLMDLHKSFGILALLLVAVRLGVRLAKGVPGWPAGMTRNGQRLATGSHHLLYTVMFILPLLGLLNSFYGVHPTAFFGWHLPSPVTANKVLQHRFGAWHSDLAWVLAVAVGIHFMAALYHRIFVKDGIFERMLPFHRR